MTADWAPYALLAAPALAVFLLTLFNVAVWPRGRPDGGFTGRVSLLIPARDEAAGIEACIRSALVGTLKPYEILVYDDRSADGTDRVVERIAASDPRVRLLRGQPLPAGWVGKPHACHHLAAAARGDVLVFLDADARLLPTGLARLASVLADYRAGVVTAGLRQQLGTPGERLVVPLLHLTYLAWLPLPLVWRSRDPRFLVANGQLVAVDHAAYARIGGWAAVRAEVVDDMAFCRRAKEAGERVVFADGFDMAESRMYHGWRDVWRGFSKNLYEGIGGSLVALLAVTLLYAGIFVAPYVALAVSFKTGGVALFNAALLGVPADPALRALLADRFRQPAQGILLHPAAVVALLAIAWNSRRWSRRGAIRWRGRVYADRGSRLDSAPR